MTGDLTKLQGSWRITSVEMDGRPMPAQGAIVIDGDRFTTTAMGAEYEGTIEIDPGKRPKRFDLVFTTGPENGNRSLGIYRLDGDSWTICLSVTGKTRPTAFATAPGCGYALETLARGAAEEVEAAEMAAPLEPAVAPLEGQDDLSGEWAMVDAMQEGFHLDASMVKTARRVATHNETTTYFGKQVVMRATYRTDSTQNPKTIDFVHIAGPSKGKTQLGIYEVRHGMLRLCFAVPGQPRPVDFESRPGDGRTFAVWRRANAEVAAHGSAGFPAS